MNDPLFVTGIVVAGAGAFELAWTYLNPQPARREKRRKRNLLHRARDAGLRGRYRFRDARSRPTDTARYGTYEPVDEEDRALYAAVGARLEGESALFASEALWTDERLAWVGVPLLILGAVICVIAAFS
jgi:pimeloyl-ACP methyl ester carboxylesterase